MIKRLPHWFPIFHGPSRREIRHTLSWLATALTAALCPGVARAGDPADAAHASLDDIAAVKTDDAPATALSEDQRQRLDEAQSHYDKGEWVAAIQLLEALRDEDGGDCHDVNMLLALCCMKMKFDDEARDAAIRASKHAGADADAYMLAGSLLLAHGKAREAIPYLRSATLRADTEINNPNVTWAWVQLGQMLRDQGYLTAAAEAFTRFDHAIWVTHTEHQDASDIRQWLVRNPRGAFDQRLALYRQLDDKPAQLALTTEAAQRWPDDPAVVRAHISALTDAGKAAEAFDLMRPRLEDAAGRSAYVYSAVTAAIQAKRLDGWLKEITPAGGAADDLPLAIAVANVLPQHKRLTEAAHLAEAILAVAPDKIDVALLAAETRAALGDGAAALDLIAKLVREHGDGAAWSGRQLNRAVAIARSIPDLPKLVRTIQSADPDFASRFVLGLAAQARNDRDTAARCYAEVIADHPDCTAAPIANAELMLSRYDWDAAKAYGQSLVEQYPKLAAAYYILGCALEGLDESADAEAAYRQAVRLDENEPTYALTLARFYRRTGPASSAERYFSMAISADPANDEAFERLIESYLRSGKNELALDEFNRLKDGGVSDDAIRRVETTLRYINAPYSAAHLSALAEQLNEHPDDVETRQTYATGLFLSRHYREAIEQIQQAMDAAPDNYELAMDAAEMLRRRAMFSQSADILRRIRERYPNRTAVLARLSSVLISDFQLDEGRELLRRLMKGDDGDTYRMRLYDSYATFGDIDGGLALVDSWLADNPDDTTTRGLKVALLLAGKRNDEACALAETWFKANPDDPALMRQRLNVLEEAGRGKEAFAIARKWLAEQPDDVERRAAAYFAGQMAEEYDELADMLRASIKDGDQLSNPVRLTDFLIDVLIAAKKPDAALKVARDFQGAYSDQVMRRLWMGRCHAAAGDRELTIHEFEALLGERTLPSDQKFTVRQKFVEALIQLKAFDEALKRCDTWIAESDSTRLDYLNLKRQVLQLSQADDADVAAVMEQILPYRRDDEGINNDLAYTWADFGIRLPEAEDMIRYAVGQQPLNAAFVDSLGWVLYKRGDFAGAEKQLSHAAQLRDNDDAEIVNHLADAQYRLGKKDAALASWKHAIEILEQQKPPLLKREEAQLANLRLKVQAMADGKQPPIAAVPPPDQD